MVFMQDVITRFNVPVELRIGVLVLLTVFFALYVLSPSWLASNWILSTLPVQRFKWKSETLLSSSFNRAGSVLTTTLALGLLIAGRFHPADAPVFGWTSLPLLELFLILLALFALKMYAMKFYFRLHDQSDLGAIVIDYHYGFNQISSLALTSVLCLDVFIFRLHSELHLLIAGVIGLLFVLRLLGTIILLLNKFDYTIISLFIYLCAFEIAPALIGLKLIFENS